MKRAMTVGIMFALLLAGISIGRASTADETILTVQVNSADHETEEGYFSLGKEATVMVKPGSDLFRFLRRQRGNTVKVVLTQTTSRELSKINR